MSSSCISTHLVDSGVKEASMEFSLHATVMVALIIITTEITMENIDDHPKENLSKRQVQTEKRLTQKEKEFIAFAEEKLIQHSQALEHLLKLVHEAVSALRALADNVSRNVEEPKLPEKVESYHQEAEGRSGDINESRRSFGGKPLILPSAGVSNIRDGSSQWCSVAVLCHRTTGPACGFDDKFGYGKFDDLCHMLQVNCYWKYNFALVPNCKPIL